MRSDGYLKTAWIMTVLFSIILPLHSQTPRQFSIELKDKPLPAIIRKSKFPQNPKRSVRFSGKRTKRSVQKRKARNTQKAETKVL